MKKNRNLLWLLILVSVAGCAPKISTTKMHQTIETGNSTILIKELEADDRSKKEFWYWLNMGRLYQHEGLFSESIAAFSNAEGILIEYEDRAKLSMRDITSGVGSALFSAGAEKYYGKGYERSLMHTLNSFNYIMTNNIMSACVELKKMEQRQEFWLQESEAKILSAAEEAKKNPQTGDSPKVPSEYSMTSMLEIPEVQALANNYQDAFSYAVSARLHTIINDTSYAEISLKRAMLLSGINVDLALNRKAKLEAAVPAPTTKTKASKAKQRKPSPAQAKRDADALAAAQKVDAEMVDVTLILMTGLAPSLKVDKLRFPIGQLNYTSLDMPALNKPMYDVATARLELNGEEIELPKLLQVDNMAYRTLKDELPTHFTKGVTRAIAKGAVAYAASSAGKNDNEKLVFQLVGLFASIAMDVSSAEMDKSFRNWEMLPNSAYLLRFKAKRGSQGQLTVGSSQIPLQFTNTAANGEFILVSYLNSQSTRIAHATY